MLVTVFGVAGQYSKGALSDNKSGVLPLWPSYSIVRFRVLFKWLMYSETLLDTEGEGEALRSF
jgi:hypothetical protein